MLCCQTIFTLLDTLHNWHSDANAVRQRELAAAVAAAPGGGWGLGECTDHGQHLLAGMRLAIPCSSAPPAPVADFPTDL